ncbi:MAG: ornithine carbamoyltransferase [Verrucomicrobiota bacterium]
MKAAPLHLLGLEDFPVGAASAIFAEAALYKRERGRPGHPRPLEGQTWALIFSKPSTRTRVSFAVGIRELGGNPLFLSAQDMQMGRGEPIKDTARVLGRMLHGLIVRTFAQDDLVELAKWSGLPVVNALTDQEHPCQVLTDIFTYQEKRGSIVGKKVAYIGDANNNMARSYVHAAKYFNFNLWLAAPEGYQCNVSNDHVTMVDSPEEAARNADLLTTDVWVSMGMEEEAALREKVFAGYQINREMLRQAHPDAMVLHCLPAYRGKEISEEVLEERAPDIFDQAENRVHCQKGVLHWLVHERLK